MKNLKVLLIGMLILFSSCSKDEINETEPENLLAFAIEYDSNTNLLKINSAEDDTWYNAIDFNTYVDVDTWEPGNDRFGMLENYDDRRIKIVSNTFELHSVTTTSLYTGYSFEGNVMYIDMPTIIEYRQDNHMFYFEINVIAQ